MAGGVAAPGRAVDAIAVTRGGRLAPTAAVAGRRLSRRGGRAPPLPPMASRTAGRFAILVNAPRHPNVSTAWTSRSTSTGVVPAEMGPKRFDEPRGAQGAGGRRADLRARPPRRSSRRRGTTSARRPKCQVYARRSRPRIRSHRGGGRDARPRARIRRPVRRRALRLDLRRLHRERRERLRPTPVPYLVSVACGELRHDLDPRSAAGQGATARGRRARRSQWRGYVLRRHTPRRAAIRAAEPRVGAEMGRASAARRRSARLCALRRLSVAGRSLRADEAARAFQLTRPRRRYYAERPPRRARSGGAGRAGLRFPPALPLRRGRAAPPAPRLRPGRGAVRRSPASPRRCGFPASRRLRPVPLARGRECLGQDERRGGIGPAGRSGACRWRGASGTAYFPAAALIAAAGGPPALVETRRPQVLALWVEMEAAGPDLRARIGLDRVGAAGFRRGARAAHGAAASPARRSAT